MLAVAQKSIWEPVLSAAQRAVGSVQRVPLIFWLYLAVVGYIYRRMMRDFLGVGTKRCRIIGKVTIPLTREEEQLSAGVVDPETITDTFATVGGLEEVKTALTECVVWPYKHPELLEQAGIGSALPTGVLLHGPPGTGKTLLARALAKELGCYFVEVGVERLFSKYVGDSEKLASAVFSLAHKLHDTVIFVDEIDSLLAQRGGDGESSAVYTHTKTIFMTKWDGLATAVNAKAAAENKKNPPRILVLGATNRMDVLDDAILRRLSVRLHVPLPSAADRKSILAIQLGNVNAVLVSDKKATKLTQTPTEDWPEDLSSEDQQLENFAVVLKNYSGSDLRELCKAALMHSFRGKIEAVRMAAEINNKGGGSGGEAAATTAAPSAANRSRRPALLRPADLTEAMKRVRASGAPERSQQAHDPMAQLFRAAVANGAGQRR